MTPLRQRMIEDMNLRNLAPRTVQVYVERVAKFAQHYGKSPEKLGAADVRAYLVYLVHKRRVSWSYYIQALCALRFLYNVRLGSCAEQRSSPDGPPRMTVTVPQGAAGGAGLGC
jgi:Phage integrase, N-terminal SAM-like domain